MSIESLVATGRSLVDTSLLDRCVIADRSVVKDSTGGIKQTWTWRNEEVRCRFGQITDDVARAVAGAQQGQATATLMLPLDVDIAEGAKVRNEADASIWIVTRNLTPASALAVARRVGIREV